MMDRRDMVFGLGCVAAAGGAAWLRPRDYQRLMPAQKLASAIPEAFGRWSIDRSIGVVLPPSEGSLADRLYDEVLARAYLQPAAVDDGSVMCLITYGARQSDALQLHRPELCYPAVGFQVVGYQKQMLTLGRGAQLPIVQMSARLGQRVEDVLYWTRVGEDFPQDAADQRAKRLRASLAGKIGDGVLVRMSKVRQTAEAGPQFAELSQFAREILHALRPDVRRGLVGTRMAALLAGAAG